MESELDMSGRIEETNRPSVLALAGDKEYTVWIAAVEKERQ
jgi:hypothetical protein